MAPFSDESLVRELAGLWDVREQWDRADALRVGRLAYDHLARADRARWAADLFAVAVLAVGRVPAEARDLLEIAATEERWGEAHEVFTAVRTARWGRRFGPLRPVDEDMRVLAENVAKVLYNASGQPAPFDANAGWKLLGGLRAVLAHCSAGPDLERRARAAVLAEP